ncbi:putative protein kinase, putative,serine/threonine protein kinase [Trypanosoma conorhini]|uniref:Protein kinase domain-containing protein n=1 Tax=Trypanosoma conorhini TaxID=83891 RepID=A0A3R7KG81_9TRYP|nr:putative protein kinase, putative,serine/threonine protein kinase [Trypanosoma conorhini]RNE99810.1 putative protein kinase, putative,serine/threonine protein kinase [Trypanosoma conorhini]
MVFADYLLKRCFLRKRRVQSLDQSPAPLVTQEVQDAVAAEPGEGTEAPAETGAEALGNGQEDSPMASSQVNLPILGAPKQRGMGGAEHSPATHSVDRSDIEDDDIVLEEEQKKTATTNIPLKHDTLLLNDGQNDDNSHNSNSKDCCRCLVPCSAWSSNIICFPSISAVPPNRWTGLDPDDDELAWTGSTLDEPMTPQSYSSMRTHNDFNPLNRSVATGNAKNSCTSDSIIQGLLRQDGKCPNCALARSAISQSPPNSTLGKQSSETHQSGKIRVVNSAVSEHLSRESEKPPLCVTVHGSTEVGSHSSNPILTNVCVCSEAHSAKEKYGLKTPTNFASGSFPGNESTSLWPPDSFPPEPKELVGVNSGRTRSRPVREKVVECRYAHEQVVGKYQHLLNDKYVIYPRWNLGVGSYSEVMLCYNLEDKIYYAMKVMDRARLQRRALGVDSPLHRVKCEIAIMKKLRHDNILALVEVVDDPRSRKIYLVLELAELGELLSMENDGTVVPTGDRKALTEHEVVRVMHSIVSAAMYAHQLGIAHRDIKPQNIVLTAEGDAKLSDFGVSIIVGDSAVRVRREGTVAFLPPEMLVSSEVLAAPSCPRQSSSCSSSNGNCTTIVSATTSSYLTQGVKKGISTVFSASLKKDLFGEPCNHAEEEAGQEPTLQFSPPKPTRVSATSPAAGSDAIPQVDLFKADVFSLGVTAFVLLMGRLPWRARDVRSQRQAILSDPDPFGAEPRSACGVPEDGSHPQRTSGGGANSQLCLDKGAPLGSATTLHRPVPAVLDGAKEEEEEMGAFRDGRFQLVDANDLRPLGAEKPRGCRSFTSLPPPEEVAEHPALGERSPCRVADDACETGNNPQPSGKPKPHPLSMASSDSGFTWDTQAAYTHSTLAGGNITAIHAGWDPGEETHASVFSADQASTEGGSAATKTVVPGSLPHFVHAAGGQFDSALGGSPTPQLEMEATMAFQQTALNPVDTSEAPTHTAEAATANATEHLCVADRRQPFLPTAKTNGPVSANAIDFIRRCLNVDAAKRSSMEELYYHPWLQSARMRAGDGTSPVDVAAPTPCPAGLPTETQSAKHVGEDTSMSSSDPDGEQARLTSKGGTDEAMLAALGDDKGSSRNKGSDTDGDVRDGRDFTSPLMKNAFSVNAPVSVSACRLSSEQTVSFGKVGPAKPADSDTEGGARVQLLARVLSSGALAVSELVALASESHKPDGAKGVLRSHSCGELLSAGNCFAAGCRSPRKAKTSFLAPSSPSPYF